MTISSESFRDVLRHFPAGVTLLTACVGGERHGMTVSAFSSVSADPPLVTVIVDRAHSMHSLLEDPAAAFAINFLAADQQNLSDRFAFEKTEDRFLLGSWQVGSNGAPVLSDAVAVLECRRHASHSAGSHVIYIGAVVDCRVARPDARPLVYWNRGYRQLADS